jgi:eukaryotic-like serine/threonine-protein kinase
MGIVYKARHTFLKTTHAIKVILPDLVGNNPSLVTRFRQEAMAAAAIRHQNIVSVTDFGVTDRGMPFLVMEFIKGVSLQDILAKEGRLSPEQTIEIISAVGAGVAAAHRQGIVHRDLKPLNIIIQDGMPIKEGVKILDFGLAKIKSGEWLGSFVQAQTTGLMGSPYYMAPEQWSEEELDARADIYSLGIIAYQMLTGDLPFKGSSMPAIMKKHLSSTPPTFASLGLHLPAKMEAAINHALEKEPHKRPEKVEDFIAELHDALNSLPSIELNITQQFDTPQNSSPSIAINAAHTTEILSTETESNRTIQHTEQIANNSFLSTAKDINAETITGNRLESFKYTKPEQPNPNPQKRTVHSIFTIAAIAALIIFSSVGYLVYRMLQPDGSTVVQEHKSIVKEIPSTKREMIEIPGGTFMMGRNGIPDDPKLYNQTPAHQVTVKSFFIDRTEVTNAEYAEFVKEMNYPAPEGINWSGNQPLETEKSLPVRNISMKDAEAFAAWRSKRDGVTYRLPTEEEWEYVARGGEKNSLYPWGDNWSNDYANISSSSTKPVGSYKQVTTAWNVSDMIGNVWEWTSSKASIYPGNTYIKIPSKEADFIVVRGGSYQSVNPKAATKEFPATTRQWVAASTKNETLGFRLVRD